MKKIGIILLMFLFATSVCAQEDQSGVEIYKIRNIWKIGFVSANASLDNYGKTAFGLTYGQVKKYGYFATVMTNFNFDGFKSEYECGDDLLINGYYPEYTKENFMSFSILGGFVYRLNGFFYLRTGAGFGAKVLSYNMIDDKRVRNIDTSAIGVDLLVGTMFCYRRMLVSLDCVTTNFKYVEGRIGIGIYYKR